MADSATPEVWYEANCHCAAIKYKVKLPPLESLEIVSCNCSICTKNGYFNVYPKRKDLVYIQGEDSVKGYLFGKKACVHKFCPMCGSSLFVEPDMDDVEGMALNVILLIIFCVWRFADTVKVRMIKDIDLDMLKYKKFDGKTKLNPPYNP